MPRIVYKDESFEYEVIKKRKKNIGISITPEGNVKVTSPLYLEDSYINKVVYNRAGWILSKLKLIEEINKASIEKIYTKGDKIVYLGEEFKFKVIEEVEGDGRIKLKGNTLEAFINPDWDEAETEKIIKERLTDWYKHEAFKKFKERTIHYSEILQLYPNNIRVKEQKSIWGSCSSKNNINFNWRLIMAPLDVLDYIVVHELCHLKHRDHSKNFWDQVEQIIPDYEEKKKWLRENGRSLKV